MRYTESNFDVKLESPYDYIRILFSCLFIAPVRILNEISKKMLYVSKEALEKIFLTAIVVCTIVTVYEVLLGILARRINFIYGKIPIASLLMSLAGLFGIYYFLVFSRYTLYDKAIIIEKDESEISNEPVIEEPVETSKIKDVKEVPNNVEEEIELEMDTDDSQLGRDISDLLNLPLENFQADLREDEFLKSRLDLEKSVEEDKYNLSGLLGNYIESDILPDDLSISWDESKSQSLFFYDEKTQQ